MHTSNSELMHQTEKTFENLVLGLCGASVGLSFSRQVVAPPPPPFALSQTNERGGDDGEEDKRDELGLGLDGNGRDGDGGGDGPVPGLPC